MSKIAPFPEAPHTMVQAPVQVPHSLPPLLDPAVAQLLHTAPQALRDWVEHYGSPLNVVFPERLKQNV